MKNGKFKVGDIFFARLDNKGKKYLQYIANDISQLNSDVIRVYDKRYHIEENPELEEVIKNEVEFYAHCITKWGVKLGYWEKVGNMDYVGNLNVLFRDSGDVGTPEITLSNDWWIWKINEKSKWVGKLEGENRKAENGQVIPPDSIIHRMSTGKYDFVYPGFE